MNMETFSNIMAFISVCVIVIVFYSVTHRKSNRSSKKISDSGYR
jgi:uncharacterized membrane protein